MDLCIPSDVSNYTINNTNHSYFLIFVRTVGQALAPSSLTGVGLLVPRGPNYFVGVDLLAPGGVRFRKI